MNKETARSEFVLTAAGYPVMVALRGLGVRTYHAIMGKAVPLLLSGPRPVYRGRLRTSPPMPRRPCARNCTARLPEVHAGNVVALLEAGAYPGISASNFNALSRPATVLVNGRDAEIVKRAETVEDVWARDVVPARLQRARETAEAARPGAPLHDR